METNLDMPTLNAVQQTLRTLTLAMATACKADLHVLSDLLTLAAGNKDLMPEAQAMIADLGAGMSAMANGVTPKGMTN